MKDIIYLKNEQYGTQFIAYNPNNLTSMNIYRCEDCYIQKYEDEESLEDSVSRDLGDDFKITTRQEFQDMLIDYVTLINKTTAEL